MLYEEHEREYFAAKLHSGQSSRPVHLPNDDYSRWYQSVRWATRCADTTMHSVHFDSGKSISSKPESQARNQTDDHVASMQVTLVPNSSQCSKIADMITHDLFEDAKKAAVEHRWSDKLPIQEFLQRAGLLNGRRGSTTTHIIDVRAPCEYSKGHIPGAISVPLFDDEERAEIGTMYKKQGHDVAVKRGLKIVESKGWQTLLGSMPEVHEGDEVLVYCFRGGMRSGGMAQLLSRAPVHVSTLAGGYKAFRNWSISQWEQERDLVVVGGPTGSGKTDVLTELRDTLDQQVIDLEGDANHRGSIFGALGRPMQPTNEHYENILALQWANFDASSPVFIEDEGVAVGKVGVPSGLWARMRQKSVTVLRLEVPRAARVVKLVSEYGQFPAEDLARCCKGLAKRLGQAKVNEIVSLLEGMPPKLAEVADFLLEHYYDGMYQHLEQVRPGRSIRVPCDGGDALENSQRILAKLSGHERSSV